jgi:hypothetical protein
MSEDATYEKGINVILNKPVNFEKLGKVLRVMGYDKGTRYMT